MFFSGRIKRQQAMAQVTDPLLHKSILMVTALLKKRLGEETKFPNEILWFSMWLVYLAFSTAKPNSSKIERQSLNDAYNQVFINLGMDAYEASDLKDETNVTAFATLYARDLMNFFITRQHEYDDAFNMDKGTSFAVSDEDFGDFVPVNLLSLSIRNIYGPEYAISDPSSLDREFVHGFMDFFSNTLLEAAGSFESFSPQRNLIMKTMFSALLLVSLILTMVAPASAQQGSSVIGYGTAPCSAYVKAYDERGDEYFVFGAWIGGFMTATGFRAPEFRSSLLNIQMPDAQAWIANYCRKKSQAFVVEAVEHYTFYLYKKYN